MLKFELDPSLTLAVSTVSDGNMKASVASGSTPKTFTNDSTNNYVPNNSPKPFNNLNLISQDHELCSGEQLAEINLVRRNRKHFLDAAGMDIVKAARVCITYDRTDFCQYAEVDELDFGAGMSAFDENGKLIGPEDTEPADGLATRVLGQVLFLPVADCMPVVLFHRPSKTVMLTHLGRHSVEQNGGLDSVKFLLRTASRTTSEAVSPDASAKAKGLIGGAVDTGTNIRSNPQKSGQAQAADVIAWLGPSPNGDAYPLHKLNNQSFRDAVAGQLTEAGIPQKNLFITGIDTVTDERFFSHSEYLAGRQALDGRYAVAVALRQ